MPDTIDALVNNLPDEVVSLISDLADENQTLQKSLEEAQAEIAKRSEPADDGDPIAKALSELPPEVANVVKSMREELDQTRTQLTQAEIAKADQTYIVKAQEFASMGDPTTLGPVLRRVASHSAEDAEAIEKAFRQAHARLESADIFKELGNGLPAPGSVDEQVATIAKSYVDKGEADDLDVARAMVWENRPDLYEMHVNERQAR